MKIKSRFTHVQRLVFFAVFLALIATIVIAAITTLSRSTSAAESVTFSEFATHPYASKAGYDRTSQNYYTGVFLCTTADFCPVGQSLNNMSFTSDGTLIATYGNYASNVDSFGVDAGRVGVVPLDIATQTWGNMTFAGSESIDSIRTIGGKQYIPTTDPSDKGGGKSGYLTNVSGAWQFKADNTGAVHQFDMTTLTGSDLWLFGSREWAGGNEGEAVAWRSTDNGATWQQAASEGNQPGQGNGFERFYWGARLGSKIYMQAQGISPTPPVRIFDGVTWTTGTTQKVCPVNDAKLVEVYKEHIVCALGSMITLYDGISTEAVWLSQNTGVGVVRDLHVADDGYLYVAGNLGVARSTDGRTWSRVALTGSNTMSVAVSADRLYLGTDNGKILRSDMTISAMPEVYAAHACFGTDIATGTITAYHSHEGDDSSQPACTKDVVIPAIIDGMPVKRIGDSAFAYDHVTSVSIPSSVTSIGPRAFYQNHLSNLVIPDTVTSIGDGAFESNQLTSLTLSCGVTSIGSQWFAINKLTEVTVPDCITSVDPTAFFGQNPWGGTVETNEDPNHAWSSNDPNVAKFVHDNHWYAQLHTSNPSNPNYLTDGVTHESYYTGDLNGDSDSVDSIGGHLVNPVLLSTRYVDESNNHLSADNQSTGRLTNGVNLTDYLVNNIQAPKFANEAAPTAVEQAEREQSLRQYYRLGSSVSLSAPNIPGYTLLSPSSPHQASLSGRNNTVSFIYRTTQSPPDVNSVDNSTSSVRPGKSQSATSTAHATVSTPTVDQSQGANLPAASIDFSTLSGSPTNADKQIVSQGLAPIIAKSSLRVDTSKPCREIKSAQLLSSSSFVAPDTGHKTLGGLAFELNCETKAGDARVTFSLGDTITDLSSVKVYKKTAGGRTSDITNLVQLANQVSGNSTRTTISYAIKDGGSLDDDGIANHSITDPIYIAVPDDATEATVGKKATWPLLVTIASLVAIAISMMAGILVIRKKLRA